jgi:site-specific DNA-cytosine methylase
MKPINLELFSCAGGMAEGFRRAGIEFDMAVDYAEDHCSSYEQNIGHRPIRMDVRDLLRMVKLGWRVEISLFVADPPCTPWSRAGKRLGTADERDMLEVTCELISVLKPRRYLIGNVPGLDDSINLPIVQRVIGGLSRFGYCTADFARLDAADYGVPQHRIRPFWFGHLDGPCIRWPAPTHGDPNDSAVAAPLPGFATLTPWVSCKQALAHLDETELGRPVRMRRAERELSARSGGIPSRHEVPVHTSSADKPARSITTQCRAAGHATTIVLDELRSSDDK